MDSSGPNEVLRGNFSARIDPKGRLKVPNGFRVLIQRRFGRDLFITSLTGDSVRIYPLPVWVEIEAKLAAVPSTLPAKVRFADRVNYFGQVTELDAQGRALIPQRLRDSAGMTGEVDVFGNYDSLDVWNHERFLAKLQREPFTDADAQALAQFGI